MTTLPASTLRPWLIAGLIMVASFRGFAFTGPDGRAISVDYRIGTPAMSLEDVQQEAGWQRLQEQSPNFGYVKNPYWFRFELTGAPDERLFRYLEIGYPQLDEIRFFLLRDGQVVARYRTGDHFPFDQRPVAHPHFLFPITLEPDARYTVYLRVQTQGSLQVPLHIRAPGELFNTLSRIDQGHAAYYGILVVVIVFNLLFFISLRERVFLFYVTSTLGYLWLMMTLRGTGFELLWPESPGWQNQSMLASIPFATLFSVMFAREFLRLKHYNRFLNGMLLVIAAVIAVALALSFLLSYNQSVQLSVALAIPSFLLLALIGPVEWYRGNPGARLYTIAWAMLTIGTVLTALNKYGLLPTNVVTEFGIQLGSALEALILTVALGQRLYEEHQARIKAQAAQLKEQAERRQVENRLMRQALHDPVSGLPNHAFFEMLVRDLIERERPARFVVGILALRNHHAITKTLGHANAEQLLSNASRRFNTLAEKLPGIVMVEQYDADTRFWIAHLETEAFAFILDAWSASQAPRDLERHLAELREPVEFLGMRVPLDPVTGMAIYPDHGRDASTLVRQAYIAQESEEARDRALAYYDTRLDSYSTDRLTQVADLKEALENNELALYFQPKLSLTDNTVVGAEALIRWPAREDRIHAQALVDIAEQTGLIKPLTRWVLENALKARENFLAAGFDLDISVNISPLNLREPDFTLFVQRLMTAHLQHRGRIYLELTETSMMQDPLLALRTLQSLDYSGIPLAIDDFGSGYSSLSYIKRLPAREIKIDRSLIHDLCQQQDDRVIVQTTIDMCHSLGYQVVAEGVETEDVWLLLDTMGCDMVQGFALLPPCPLDSVIRWLRERDGAVHRRQGM